MKIKILKILTLVSYVLMVVANYLAVTIPLGGKSTGEISESYPNLFAPASYAFSIWGLIYILLGIYVIYQFFCKKDEIIRKVSGLFIINALLNTSWIFAWHYDIIWLSVLIIIGLLITLIKIADLFKNYSLNKIESCLVRLPFSIYFGWITVATIANIVVFLVYLGWNGFGLSNVFWTIIILLIGAIIGSWRILKDRFLPYSFVLIWAYGAILYKHISVNGFAKEYPDIIWTVALCLLIFIIIIGFVSFKKRRI